MEMDKKPLRVCFFQAYTCGYIRAQTLLKGLRENGLDVVECVVNKPGLSRYPQSILKFLKSMGSCDVVVANYRSFEILFILRLLTRKPIVYDPFLSVWQTVCEERKWFLGDSLPGRLLFFVERWNCKMADHVLIDSKAHKRYFEKTFSVDPKKITVIYTSCDDALFFPRPKEAHSVGKVVFWCGSGIPLQGLGVVYEAFKSLPEGIVLRVAGSSRIISDLEAKAAREGVKNIVFLGRLAREDVAREIANADICLGGHYSKLSKAGNVVSGKVYEMIATRKPVIVGASDAVKELFVDGVDVLMCEAGSPRSLAESIVRLCNDEALSDRLAENAYRLFLKTLLPRHTGKPFAEVLERLAGGI
ncbi:MAG: glycosyltransferase family 4 protein [Candidatus Altiarchaeota archaeon]